MMTPKKRLFIKEYLKDLNGTQAAIRAKYSPKTANEQAARLLADVSIKGEIQKAMDKRAEKVELSADYVLKTIRDTVERCNQTRPVLDRSGKPVMVETADGEVVPAYTFDAPNVLKGCELLGRHLSIWKDVGSKENPLTTDELELSSFDRANRLASLIAQAQNRMQSDSKKPTQ